MTQTRLHVPRTTRLARLAAAWARSPKPEHIPAPVANQESVWDYPRPPAIEQVSKRVQVIVGEVCIADSRQCLRVLETASPPTVYFPPQDVEQSRLQPEPGSSSCEWKGVATYLAVVTSQTVIHRAAWCYANPFDEYAALTGYISFYPGRVTRCVYGDETARPQPGGFYGGWVTSNLVGPFKGEPGSEGW